MGPPYYNICMTRDHIKEFFIGGGGREHPPTPQDQEKFCKLE